MSKAILVICICFLTIRMSRDSITAGEPATKAKEETPRVGKVTKALYEKNVLPWGKGTNFIKDEDGTYWVVPKYLPPIQANEEGVPIFPLDQELWERHLLAYAKEGGKPEQKATAFVDGLHYWVMPRDRNTRHSGWKIGRFQGGKFWLTDLTVSREIKDVKAWSGPIPSPKEDEIHRLDESSK